MSATRKRKDAGKGNQKSAKPKRANMQQAVLFVSGNRKMFKISTDPMAPTVLPWYDITQMSIKHDGTTVKYTGWIFHTKRIVTGVHKDDNKYSIWCEKQPTEEEVHAATATCSHAVYGGKYNSTKGRHGDTTTKKL